MKTKSLVLWLNSDCNLNCKYCYANAGEHPNYMEFETAKKAIDAMGNDPIKIQFTGGEPLLSPNLLFQICKYVKDRDNVILSLQTNGTLINEDIAKKIKKYKIGVGVSIDGPKELNDYQRGKTAKVLKGIRRLANEGIFVNVNSVLTNKSIEYLDGFYDQCLLLGNIPSIAFDSLRITGRAKENSDLKPPSKEQIKRYFKDLSRHIEEMNKIFGNTIKIREFEKAKLRLAGMGDCKNYCYAALGQSYVVIPNGEVYACGSLIADTDYFIGHVDEVENWRKIKIKSSKSKELCQDCPYNTICPGICPAASIIERGSQESCFLKYMSFQLIKQWKYNKQ